MTENAIARFLRKACFERNGYDNKSKKTKEKFKHSAFTDCTYTQSNICSPLLFVNAGIDASRSLEEQGDCFWWGHSHFKSISLPYNPYQKVFRGFDPENGGCKFGNYTATLDNNCGRGGNLVSAQIASDGHIIALNEF